MENLKKALKEANIKHSDISKKLNIKSLSTISLKVNGKSSFTTKEASILKQMINERSGKQYTIDYLFK